MLEGSMVEKLPVWGFIIWFCVYLLIHIIVGVLYDRAKKNTPKVIITEDDKALKQTEKVLKFLFSWMPAIFIILIVASLLV